MVILKLSQFSAIFIFLAYCKAPNPTTNAPANRNAPNDMTGKETLDGPNPPVNKYIALNTFHLNFFLLLQLFFDRAQKCVAIFPLDP